MKLALRNRKGILVVEFNEDASKLLIEVLEKRSDLRPFRKKSGATGFEAWDDLKLALRFFGSPVDLYIWRGDKFWRED